MTRLSRRTVLALLALGLLGCAPGEGADASASPQLDPPTTILNITSGGEEDPHSVPMALQLAGHSLDAGRTTVLFFNVRGVTIPTLAFPDSVSFGDQPITVLLQNLVDRGVEVHVCPHCMDALGVTGSDLMPGAQVTDRESLFGHMGGNTVVFTY